MFLPPLPGSPGWALPHAGTCVVLCWSRAEPASPTCAQHYCLKMVNLDSQDVGTAGKGSSAWGPRWVRCQFPQPSPPSCASADPLLPFRSCLPGSFPAAALPAQQSSQILPQLSSSPFPSRCRDWSRSVPPSVTCSSVPPTSPVHGFPVRPPCARGQSWRGRHREKKQLGGR